MFDEKLLRAEIIKEYDYPKTKEKVDEYFKKLETVIWYHAKINCHKGLGARYDLSKVYQQIPYSSFRSDEFNLSAKEYSEEQLKRFISSYFCAKKGLNKEEQIFIEQHYVNFKYDEEIAPMLNIATVNGDSYALRRIKRSAVIKFAEFLEIAVLKTY